MKTLTITAPDDLFAQAIDAVCSNYGYVANEEETKTDYAKRQLTMWIRENIEAYAVKAATAQVDAAREQIGNEMDQAASSIVVDVQ